MSHEHLDCGCGHDHEHKEAEGSNYSSLVQFAFAVGAIAVLVGARDAAAIKTLSIVFVSIVLEAIPFMLLGAVIGGLLEVFVSRDKILGLLPSREWLTVIVAAGLGFVMPVCECAVVPVVRRLLRKGVPFAAAVAYLLGGPITNPLVAGSTAVAYSYDWKVVILRVLFGYVIAVGVGLAVGSIFEGDEALIPGKDDDSCGCAHDHDHDHEHHHDEQENCGCGHDHSHEHHQDKENKAAPTFGQKLHTAMLHAADDFFDIGRYLIIGAFIAALIQTVIKRQTFLLLSGQPWLAILLMMILAVTLNLCSEADAFVAASFKTLMPLSAQLSFMVLGPMVDIKLLLMYLGVFKKKAIVAIATLVTVAVFVGMLVFHYAFAALGGP